MTERHPLLAAIAPLATALDAELVEPADMADGDVPLAWEGTVVGGFRMPSMRNALKRLVAVTESELGGSLADLERTDKQRAVRMLEEKGAFELRRSIEEVADLMGVSRITIYNYLNTVREEEAS
jgi:hypothetical protein